MIVRLKSPFNGAIIQHAFVDGQPPTLATMEQAGFVVVDEEPAKSKAKRKDTGA